LRDEIGGGAAEDRLIAAPLHELFQAACYGVHGGAVQLQGLSHGVQYVLV
jgi:hypothetical protein